MGKVVVITGASSGIGRATAGLLAREGYLVYDVSRSGVSTPELRHVTADVTSEAQVAAAMQEICSEAGSIDILVNNAGMGISGPVEFTALADARRIFDVNFFGAFLCTKACLPYLRASGGRIVNLSSVAAPLAIPYQAFYSATKSAINSLTLALRNEVAPLGVTVCAVMPGDARTGFTAARRKASAGDDVYPHARHAVAAMEKDEQNGMPPETVAAVVRKAATVPHPHPLYTAGGKYKLFVLINKLLPLSLINRLVGKIYA